MGDGRVWNGVDAWVLATVARERRHPLIGLVRAAECGQPELLAPGRLQGCLGALVGSGLLRVYEDGTLEITDDAEGLLDEVARDDLACVTQRLAAVEPTPVKLTLPRAVLDALEHTNERSGS